VGTDGTDHQPGPPAAAAGHYFDPSPAIASRPATVDLTLPDLQLTLTTDRGVFGTGGIDPGTKYLLLDGPVPDPGTDGHLLDLGCGYGPIALALARRAPGATVWAVDVNERARALAAANADAVGATNVRVAAPEEVPDDVRFTGIWSNPPIRIGKPALHALLLTWLDRLVPSGHAWLVVHKHLGSDSLARWLDRVGFPAQRLGSRAGYRILEVAPR
jgi:16S rRNA (guanine1207-N2)-methyltransferase